MTPIYVLSLRRSTERRRAVAERLASLGLPFAFFDAIDARDGLVCHEAAIDRAALAERTGRTVTEAEIACALSHAAICRDILARRLGAAYVLEDDAIVGPAFAEIVTGEILERSGLDLVLLYHKAARVFRRRLPLPLPAPHRAYLLAKSPLGAVAYFLTARAAAALAAAASPVRYVADWPLDLSTLGAAVIQPCPVAHPEAAAGGDAAARSTLAAGRTPAPRRGLGAILQPGYLRYALLRKPFTRKIS